MTPTKPLLASICLLLLPIAAQAQLAPGSAPAGAPSTRVSAPFWWDSPPRYELDLDIDEDKPMPAPSEQTAASAPIFEKAEAAAKAGERSKALDAYEEIFTQHPWAAQAADALRKSADLRVAKGDYVEAIDLLDRIIVHYPQYAGYNAAIEEVYRIGGIMKDTKTGSILWIIPDYEHSDAIRGLLCIPLHAPHSAWAPKALERIAEIYQLMGSDRRDAAIGTLKYLTQRYPGYAGSGEALMQLGDIYSTLSPGSAYNQAPVRESIRHYEDYIATNPKGPRVAEAEKNLKAAREKLARSRYDLGAYHWTYRKNAKAAVAYLDEAINSAVDSKAADEARELKRTILAAAPGVDPRTTAAGRNATIGDTLAVWRPERKDAPDDVVPEVNPEAPAKVPAAPDAAQAKAPGIEPVAPEAPKGSEPAKIGLGGRIANTLFFWRKKSEE